MHRARTPPRSRSRPAHDAPSPRTCPRRAPSCAHPTGTRDTLEGMRCRPCVFVAVVVSVHAFAACSDGTGAADDPDVGAGGDGGDAAAPFDGGAITADAEAGRDAGPIDWTVNGHLL